MTPVAPLATPMVREHATPEIFEIYMLLWLFYCVVNNFQANFVQIF